MKLDIIEVKKKMGKEICNNFIDYYINIRINIYIS